MTQPTFIAVPHERGGETYYNLALIEEIRVVSPTLLSIKPIRPPEGGPVGRLWIEVTSPPHISAILEKLRA